MLRKKQVLAVVGIVCVFAVCLTVITVEGAWDGTLDGFLDDWDSLRHKVWQSGYASWNTYYLTGNTHGWANIREALDEIKDQLGQGLVGEEEIDSESIAVDDFSSHQIAFYSPPHPKKYSVHIKVAGLESGDMFNFEVKFRTVVCFPQPFPLPPICLSSWDPIYVVGEGELRRTITSASNGMWVTFKQVPIERAAAVYITRTNSNPAGDTESFSWAMIVEEV